MKRLSSLAILAAFSIAAAAPAIANANQVSIAAGEKICKAAVSSQAPAPKSVKVSKDETRVSTDTIQYTIRATTADGAKTKLVCTINRDSRATDITPAA